MTDGEYIKIGRHAAKSRGHDLKRGTWAPETKNHARMYYAWCKSCECSLVVESGHFPRGTATRQQCQGIGR